jgi:hypothetical protein
MLRGSEGEQAVTLYGAQGQVVATAHDMGLRHQAIVGSGDASMLFPTLPATGPVHVRAEHLRQSIQVIAVDMTATIQAQRDYDFLHFGIATVYACIALVAAGLGVMGRDRGLWLLAVYFAFLIVNELVLTGVVFSVWPNFSAYRTLNIAYYRCRRRWRRGS